MSNALSFLAVNSSFGVSVIYSPESPIFRRVVLVLAEIVPNGIPLFQ